MTDLVSSNTHFISKTSPNYTRGRMVIPEHGKDSMVREMFAKSSISENTSELIARFASNVSSDVDKKKEWICEITTPSEDNKNFILKYTDSWSESDFHKFFIVLKHKPDEDNDTMSSESIGARAAYSSLMCPGGKTVYQIYLEEDYDGYQKEIVDDKQIKIKLSKGFHKLHMKDMSWEHEEDKQRTYNETFYTKITIPTKESRIIEFDNDISEYCKDLKRFFNTQPHVNLIINGVKQQLCEIAPTIITEDMYKFKPTFLKLIISMCSNVKTKKQSNGIFAGKIIDVKYGGYNKDVIRKKEFLDNLKGRWLNFHQTYSKKNKQYAIYAINETGRIENFMFFDNDCIQNSSHVEQALKKEKKMIITCFNSFSNAAGHNITNGLEKTKGLYSTGSFIGMYFHKNNIPVNFQQPYRFETGGCPSGDTKSCLMPAGWRGNTKDAHYKKGDGSIITEENNRSGKYLKSLPVMQVDQYYDYKADESYLHVRNGKKTDTAPKNGKKAKVIQSLWAFFNEHLYHLNPHYIGSIQGIKPKTDQEKLEEQHNKIEQLEKEKKKAEQKFEQENRKKEEERRKNEKLEKELKKTTQKEIEERNKNEKLEKELKKEKEEKERVEKEKEEEKKKVENIEVRVVEKEKQNKKLKESLEKTKEENIVLKKDKMEIETENASKDDELENIKADINYNNPEITSKDCELVKSYLYLLTDPSREQMFKVGWSSKTEDELRKQSRYGPVGFPFGINIESWIEIETIRKYMKLGEKLLHNRYNNYRLNPTEWFIMKEGQNVEKFKNDAISYMELMKNLIKPI